MPAGSVGRRFDPTGDGGVEAVTPLPSLSKLLIPEAW